MEPRPVELARVASRVDRPEESLRALAALNGELEVLEAIVVDNALAAGWTWTRIANALGVTKQAAHKKHARRRRDDANRTAPGRIVVTGEARKAVYLARQEAQALGRESVDGAELLLGLMRQGETPAARALASLGLDVRTMRGELKHRGDMRAAGAARELPAIGSEGRKALEQSLREAVRLEGARLGSEHLLLALLRDGSGSAVSALEAVGLSSAAVETRLLQAVAEVR
jgi:hypothetical protein